MTDAELKKVKADMKKCTSFVKKLRSFQEAHTDSAVKDVRTLRLTKYISEAVPALCEPLLKPSDLVSVQPVLPSARLRGAERAVRSMALEW